MKIIGTNLKDVNELQESIVLFITEWAHHEKIPVPRRIVIKEMEARGIKSFTVINALRSLSMKGYIRKAVTISNSTSFVLLRTL